MWYAQTQCRKKANTITIYYNTEDSLQINNMVSGSEETSANMCAQQMLVFIMHQAAKIWMQEKGIIDVTWKLDKSTSSLAHVTLVYIGTIFKEAQIQKLLPFSILQLNNLSINFTPTLIE